MEVVLKLEQRLNKAMFSFLFLYCLFLCIFWKSVLSRPIQEIVTINIRKGQYLERYIYNSICSIRTSWSGGIPSFWKRLWKKTLNHLTTRYHKNPHHIPCICVCILCNENISSQTQILYNFQLKPDTGHSKLTCNRHAYLRRSRRPESCVGSKLPACPRRRPSYHYRIITSDKKIDHIYMYLTEAWLWSETHGTHSEQHSLWRVIIVFLHNGHFLDKFCILLFPSFFFPSYLPSFLFLPSSPPPLPFFSPPKIILPFYFLC